MPNVTTVTITNGVPTAGTGTVSTIDGLIASGIPLTAGTAIVGKVGIDQTTPGTTNNVTNPTVGANGSAVKASSSLIGVSDGTNQQQVVAPIGLVDGVNGNNSVSAGIYGFNGATWDRVRTDTTAGLWTQLKAAVPAGTNIVGKVGIDQTTPGTTNGVQVNAALPAGTNLIGKTGIDQTTDGTTNRVAPPLSLPQTPLQTTFNPAAGTYSATWNKGGKLTFATGLASGTKISIEGISTAYNTNNASLLSSDTVYFFNADLTTTITDGAVPSWDVLDTPKFITSRAIGQAVPQGAGASQIAARGTTAFNPFIATVDASGNIYAVVITSSGETVTSSAAGKATLFYRK